MGMSLSYACERMHGNGQAMAPHHGCMAELVDAIL